MENRKQLAVSYAEICEILAFMEQKYVNMIPLKLLELFEEEKDKDYKPNINPKVSLMEQNLQRKTLALLAMLNLNYWCQSEKEKQELLKIYSDNDKKKEELREKYNTDNLFKKKETNKSLDYEEDTAIVEYKKEKFFNKVLNKIMSLFRKR